MRVSKKKRVCLDGLCGLAAASVANVHEEIEDTMAGRGS